MQYPRTLKSIIYHSKTHGPLALFHSDTNLSSGHVLTHSDDKTHVLVVTVELTWLLFFNALSFNFVPAPNKSLIDWQDSEEAMQTTLLSFSPTTQVTLLVCLICAALFKITAFLFLQLFLPNVVHLRNLFLLSTPFG